MLKVYENCPNCGMPPQSTSSDFDGAWYWEWGYCPDCESEFRTRYQGQGSGVNTTPDFIEVSKGGEL